MKKVFLLIISIILFSKCVLAEELVNYENLRLPIGKFYRMGTTDKPEIKFSKKIIDNKSENINGKEFNVTNVKNKNVVSEKSEDIYSKSLTYADLSIKKMSQEISKTLDVELVDMQADLSLLWFGAASKSETIKFAIYKLSNPDKDKPNEGITKKVLTSLAGASSLVGAGIGNPVLASAALIGGNTLGIMSQDTKALNYKYSKVNDADMIILVRKIDDLQQKIVNTYYDYMFARTRYNAIAKMVSMYKQNYENVQAEQKDVIVVADAYYREALDDLARAKGVFFEKRSILEQLVGIEIFKDFEKSLEDRN